MAVMAHDRTPGRPTAFTPGTKKLILACIRKGMYASEAANRVGIHYSTLRDWLTKGYDYQALRLEGEKLGPRERDYANFYVRFYGAEAEHVESLLSEIERIGMQDGQWTALMTILERRYPDRWKKREQTEVVGVGDRQINVHIDNSPKALLEVIKVLRDTGALAGLLAGFTGDSDQSGPVIDAEAHEVHPPHADPEAAGGDVTPIPEGRVLRGSGRRG
jgi:hypothetical protein